MWTLYFTPGTIALASLLTLEHVGAQFRIESVDFAQSAQRSPEYLKLNPKGRVPALVTPGGTLTETPAILQLVAQSFPDAGLVPFDDPYRFAEVTSFNSYLCGTVHIAHAHRMRGHRWADEPTAWEAMRKKVPESLADAFAPIEAEYMRGPWVMGERLSVCDYYLFTIARWLEVDGVDLAKLPRVVEHRTRVAALPLVQRVIAQYES